MKRNTPTSVGKTVCVVNTVAKNKKHPHERGEDRQIHLNQDPHKETPPRAWGRPHSVMLRQVLAGNTPTSVGKTATNIDLCAASWKHPHERGEDFDYLFELVLAMKHPHERGEDPARM